MLQEIPKCHHRLITSHEEKHISIKIDFSKKISLPTIFSRKADMTKRVLARSLWAFWVSPQAYVSDTVGLTRFYWILSSNPAILVEISTRITEFEERIQ